MIATHLGVIDEEQIENMSYVLFCDIIAELGKKLNYEAIVNYAGNSFCKDSWDMIMDTNPMISDDRTKISKKQQTMADFLGGARIATKSDLTRMKGYQGNGKA